MVDAISPTRIATEDAAANARIDSSLALARLRAAGGAQAVETALPFEAVLQGGAVTGPDSGGPDGAKRVFERFEAMVLSQFVATMMNAGGESILGEGTAMSAYGSLFADAVGDQLAARGGVGLAKALEASGAVRPRSS